MSKAVNAQKSPYILKGEKKKYYWYDYVVIGKNRKARYNTN